jgi:hypothetical protein
MPVFKMVAAVETLLRLVKICIASFSAIIEHVAFAGSEKGRFLICDIYAWIPG